MLMLGVILGLAAAVSQSVSYVCSRWYTAHRGGGMIRLLVLGHVIQGVVCTPLAWLLWPADLPAVSTFLPELLGVAGFYMLGQVGLFVALRFTDASRVSPLLGIKIAVLAVLTVGLLGDVLSLWQWTAVGMAVLAGFALNYSGGRLPWQATLAILLTCTAYSLSDFFIRLMLEAMHTVPPLRAALVGAALSYIVCGCASAVLLPWYGSRRVGEWAAAMPYAMAWLAGMFFLFACIGAVGVVLANILQATRGPISIALGVGVARYGLVSVETRVSRAVLFRRAAAATMMMAAIIIYVLTN